ncbi:mitochondrial ATP synthase g subunit-domain-containing protein [Scleroderma yunnanense]
MIRTSLFRRAVRQSTHSTRFASSTSTAAEAAQKKAQDALGTAQKQAEQLFDTAKRSLGPLGERIGIMLGSYRQPLLYNAAVAREVLKQIYVAENLAPPRSLSTVVDAYRTIWARARDPAYLRSLLSTGEWTRLAIYGVEAYGIFKIGEIVGRRSLVGYNLH